jgi:DNA-directed RNA polymerase specialized sigma24 family protein
VSAGSAAGSADKEFREFMDGRWPSIVRLAYGLTGNLAHAEDVAHAAFARAYASWGKVTRADDPDACLWRMVVSENLRRNRRQSAAGKPAGQRVGALLAALGRLGPRQRTVIVLRFWMNLSEAEAAHVLGCSVGRTRSLSSRALAILRADPDMLDIGLPAPDDPDVSLLSSHFLDGDFSEADVIEVGLR